MCKYDWNKLLCDKRQMDSENGSGLLIMGRNEFDRDYERVEFCRDCDFPNDVPTENDEIDPYADELIKKFENI